ncbi:MAG: PrsW family glutamic-type intramembrane protease [Candidatus Paceibacterota bacterium]|jgi:RsiW-degrading membrane proteinase PrsW (M82 family)
MQNPKILIIALVAGTIPALIWLWFWLKQDKEEPEPKGLLFLTFILGMVAVALVLPLEKWANANITDKNYLTVIWAMLEEIMKYLAVAVIALKSSSLDEPVDYPIYFITAALGFAALENTMFLIKPILLNETTVSLITGNLRFLGATLLHSSSSALIGISLGLAFYYKKVYVKRIYLFCGIIAAISLHSIFNFFIMNNNKGNLINIFSFLWVITIIIMLLFEKLRRMDPDLRIRVR